MTNNCSLSKHHHSLSYVSTHQAAADSLVNELEEYITESFVSS